MPTLEDRRWIVALSLKTDAEALAMLDITHDAAAAISAAIWATLTGANRSTLEKMWTERALRFTASSQTEPSRAARG